MAATATKHPTHVRALMDGSTHGREIGFAQRSSTNFAAKGAFRDGAAGASWYRALPFRDSALSDS